MKFLSTFAFIAPALADEIVDLKLSHVNKGASWNKVMVPNLKDKKAVNKACAPFRKGRNFVEGTPPFCDPKFKGTAFDGQMMLISAADSYGCWCDIAQ